MNEQMINLYPSLHTVTHIYCTNSPCKEGDSIQNADDDDAVEYFFNRGWRGTPKNTYCPWCAKKKLKQTNKNIKK